MFESRNRETCPVANDLRLHVENNIRAVIARKENSIWKNLDGDSYHPSLNALDVVSSKSSSIHPVL